MKDLANYRYGSELMKTNVNGYNVVSFKEKTADEIIWISQCLDYDVTAQGNTAGQAIDNLLKTIEGERLIEGGIERLPKAPQMYYDLWDSEEVMVA